jgi:putative ABC transport system permease protein
MLENYLKTAIRNILRHKGFSSINIFGLAIGMACCVVLFLYVQSELSFDRFHENSERIYRVISQSERDGQMDRFAKTPAPLAPALLNDFPEVEKTVRLGKNSFYIFYENKRFNEQVFFADPEIFELFSFPLKIGDPKSALAEPYSIVISAKTAEKYFGKENPVGKILKLGDWRDFRITGVLENIPENSHLRFDLLARFADYAGRHFEQWGIGNYYTYVLLSENFSLDAFHEKIPDFVEKYRGRDSRYVYKQRYHLQAITRIHLHSNIRGEISSNSDISHITIFSLVAFFILLIACFNYMNLSTARCSIRSKEVGLRKVIGATKSQLIRQFMGETFVLTLISLVLALVLIELILPLFNNLAGKELKADYFHNPILIAFFAGIMISVGLISGSYPALFVSGFEPARILKGVLWTKTKIPLLRRTLVIGQFAISVTFIIATALIFHQLNYMKNKKLGFEKDHVLMIPINDSEVLKKCETIKREFSANAKVLSVSASSFFPGQKLWYQNYWHEGAGETYALMMHWIAVDHDFIDTFRIEILKGRNFSKEFPGDSRNAYILNEAAVKEIGWDEPLGRQFGIDERGSVIGVVKDFHFFSMHQKIEPLALKIQPEGVQYFAVRIKPVSIPDTLAFLGGKWSEFSKTQPFEYSFLDEDYDNLYKTENRLTKIFSYIAILSIFIACLGLFGLASFMIERRAKEIGIRKILGASLSNLFMVLSREFAFCILIANIIAWPVGYYFMSRWLRNFAYRVDIGFWIFFMAAAIAMVIALFTMGYQALKAVLANPVEVLRDE